LAFQALRNFRANLLSERRTKIKETHTMPGRMMSQTMSEEDIGWDCNVLFGVPSARNGTERENNPAQRGGLEGKKNSSLYGLMGS
jgi:hypothetical protein